MKCGKLSFPSMIWPCFNWYPWLVRGSSHFFRDQVNFMCQQLMADEAGIQLHSTIHVFEKVGWRIGSPEYPKTIKDWFFFGIFQRLCFNQIHIFWGIRYPFQRKDQKTIKDSKRDVCCFGKLFLRCFCRYGMLGQVVIFEKNTFLVITRAHTKEMQVP